jgi:toxin ParE1/3/4
MPTVVYSRRARLDLVEIWNWVAVRGSAATADRIVDRIWQRVTSLERHPELGPRRPDIAAEARSLLVERWLVLYALEDDQVRIVRVVDGVVDLQEIDWPA